MIGIFIGIAAVVSLIGLGEGLRIAITSQFGFLGTDVLSVQASGINFAGPPGTATPDPLSDKLTEKISSIRGVEASFNRYIRTATMEFNDHQIIAMIASVPSGANRKTFETMVNLKADSGRLLKDGDSRKVVLGANFAKSDLLGKAVTPGDKVLLNGIQYDVIGILEKKGSFIFDASSLANDDALLNDFGDTGAANIIAVKVKDETQIPQVKDAIERFLRKERHVRIGEENFEVQSPQSSLSALNSTLFAVQLFVYIIASISLVVGGIGISNTMYTSVLEKTKDIGIMKAIGATNNTIFALFAIESGLLGLIGGIIGIILGLILSYGCAFILKLALGSDLIQASVSIYLIVGALLFSCIIGLVAGLIPAYQASKMQPVDALRFST